MPKLFIGNVPYAVSDDDLHEWIESRGFPLESVHILTYRDSGRSRASASRNWKTNPSCARRSTPCMGTRWAAALFRSTRPSRTPRASRPEGASVPSHIIIYNNESS